MYFAIIEAFPKKNTEAAQRYGGAHVACWINVEDLEEARTKALALVKTNGWRVKKILEAKSLSAEDYPEQKDGRECLEQALVDGEVALFYTFPAKAKRKRRRPDR